MKRIALAAVAALMLAGCGSSPVTPSHITRSIPVPPSPAPFLCHPRYPAEAGECIRQQEETEGKHPARPQSEIKGLLPLATFGKTCIDISKYQGIPNFFQARLAGLRCVIVQANDGNYRNPLFDAQARAIRGAGLPFGIYTFTEAFSGARQAAIAVSMAIGQGATLGAWSDVEVPGSYRHACEYVNYAQAHGFRIAGKYSSPGLVEGGACSGYDWPAEWGGGRAYPLRGYTLSQTVMRQDCGTCRYGGVSGEVDLDEDLGLLALAKPPVPPTPPSVLRERLARDRAVHRHYLILVERHRCRLDRRGHGHEIPRTHSQWRLCRGWIEEGQDAIDDAHKVKAHLARATTATATAIADRLSPNLASVEVVALPPGTTDIHVAIMQNLSGAGVKYVDLPVTQLTYTPPAVDPVVDVLAKGPSGALGGWAGRLQTIPGGRETQGEREAREAKEREAREARERLEREARERAEREARELEEREHQTSTVVGVDAGGWAWESAVRDFSGAVHYVRSSSTSYNTDTQMSLLAKYGVHLLPLFNTSPLTSNRTGYATEVLKWFLRYGHGGSFWAGKTDLGATTAEIVNEPGNPYFWGSSARTDQASYAALIEQVNSTLTAGLPASDRPRLLVSYDGGYEGDAYGRALLKADGHLAVLNLGYTVHPYGGHGSREQSALGARSRVTEAPHPVYITEVGWPTCGETGDSLNWSESEQAANITRWVSWTRSLGYVAATVSFNYADYGSNCYGIVKGAGGPHKLAYAALKAAAGS
jgi:hypothetical protein